MTEHERALRELWTEAGVSEDRQNQILAEIHAQAQPGAMVGPFRIPERLDTDLPPEVSPPYDETISEAEGWFISHAPGNGDGTIWRLERRDEDPLFESDIAAHRHVVAKAAEGSEYHRACLAFLRDHEPVEYAIVTGAAS